MTHSLIHFTSSVCHDNCHSSQLTSLSRLRKSFVARNGGTTREECFLSPLVQGRRKCPPLYQPRPFYSQALTWPTIYQPSGEPLPSPPDPPFLLMQNTSPKDWCLNSVDWSRALDYWTGLDCICTHVYLPTSSIL